MAGVLLYHSTADSETAKLLTTFYLRSTLVSLKIVESDNYINILCG